MVALASQTAGAAVRSAAAELLPADARSVSLKLWGLSALVFYRWDEAECARRRAVGAAPLDRLAVLETLLGLPPGQQVPLAALSEAQRAAVRALPRGVCDLDRRYVVRRAVRPLTVDLAVVRCTGSGWRRGLARAGRFAPFCARALLVDGPVAEGEELWMQAAFYGIGLLRPSFAGVDLVLEPRPYRPQRHTAAAWAFVEELAVRLT
ncbi:hypothetical protein [Streptomyces paromomycinus]|uniref:hypothetical protein n=1 Tax=Streptomyces paromomycinus TaxID=92743 RepID=UPI0033E8214C